MSARALASSMRILAAATRLGWLLVSILIAPSLAAAQSGACDFPVDWRELYKTPVYREQLGAECNEGKGVRTQEAGGLKSARLGCVARLYALAWNIPVERFTDVFEKRDHRPMLVYSVIQETGHSVLVRDLDEEDLDQWVNRQSPHHDPNILVCPGARVWIEVAARPRLPMKKITSEDLDRTGDAGGVLELDDGNFEGALRKLGAPADVQYPPDGAVLEPWQEVMVGAGKPQVVGPPPPPGETSILVPTASAGAGAALAYLLMRRARSSLGSASAPATDARGPDVVSSRPRSRIRVTLN